MTAAHLLLTNTEFKSVVEGGAELQKHRLKLARRCLGERTNSVLYALDDTEQGPPIHLGHPVLISLRQFADSAACPADVKAYFNDIAVVAVEPFSESVIKQTRLVNPRMTITEIGDIDASDINRLIRSEDCFYVKNKRCKVVRGKQALPGQDRYAHRLTISLVDR